MGCPDNKKTQRFVRGTSETISYNGKMPVVIYVPEDLDVQFKIYKAAKESYRAAEYRFKK